MKVYRLARTQTLPISVEQAWDYFSDPSNLAEITPPDLGFHVLSKLPERMFPGMVISYHLRPLLGIRVRWVTEITHVDEPRSFVDEQRFGPYRFWHHRHTFEEVESGVLMTDVVHYAMRFRLVGGVVERFVVRRRLDEIFNYRYSVLEGRFGTSGAAKENNA